MCIPVFVVRTKQTELISRMCDRERGVKSSGLIGVYKHSYGQREREREKDNSNMRAIYQRRVTD